MKKLLGIIGIGLIAGLSFSFFLNKKEKKKIILTLILMISHKIKLYP